MLDTDTVSYFVRGKSRTLDSRIQAVSARQLCISAITRGELLFGIALRPQATQLARLVEQFLSQMNCLAWDHAAAAQFATIATQLHRSGTPIGAMDAMIAGHAISAGAVLITNNERHFVRIAGLEIENWL
jgi:tRNA(fMet)-specific endonuclease VapC